ncbi:tRNA-uridine aminocarboxypropyltransferase [Celerinatantimonas yamalensis]|uniref:tRNA-uridine aminocarboxypropyltransferase n=1 Tax=Celerinatantimonas yamalensis TaxID=559956 RepID=A0ABW9GA80_9GAMM
MASHFPHAVQQLYLQRLSMSTRPYLARGHQIVRCPDCRLAVQFCQCHLRQLVPSDCAFCLVMYDAEVLKPSNSGRLIADLIEDTHAFTWSRTQPPSALLALLQSPQYQPIVIFPKANALEAQPMVEPQHLKYCSGKKPLFILLDGTWREAHKIYRKSLWLHHLPLMSFDLKSAPTEYSLRRGRRDFQLATAEVAALALAQAGEQHNAEALLHWFEVFCEASLLATTKIPLITRQPLALLQQNYQHAVALAQQGR